MYPATSCRCTLPCVQNASVTTGLRCAPLRRPNGLMAIRLPEPAKSSPVTSNLGDVPICRNGESGPKSKQTAESPAISNSAVPAASHAHSTRWTPPRAACGDAADRAVSGSGRSGCGSAGCCCGRITGRRRNEDVRGDGVIEFGSIAVATDQQLPAHTRNLDRQVRSNAGSVQPRHQRSVGLKWFADAPHDHVLGRIGYGTQCDKTFAELDVVGTFAEFGETGNRVAVRGFLRIRPLHS